MHEEMKDKSPGAAYNRVRLINGILRYLNEASISWVQLKLGFLLKYMIHFSICFKYMFTALSYQEITYPSSHSTLKVKLLRFKEGLDLLFQYVYSLLGN